MPTAKPSASSPSDKNKNTIGMVIVAVLLFAAGFFIGSLFQENQQLKKAAGAAVVAGNPTDAQAPQGPTEDTLAAMPAVTNDDYIRGNKDANVVLVEYSDFECPFCARFHPTTQQVLDEYGDKVALVYRQYPLPFHPNAQAAAEASECIAKVGGQDAFWKYADAIFAENDKLGGQISPDAIKTAIGESGANAAAVQACIDSGEMTQKVTDSIAQGSAAGISGTPGTIIVVNGTPKELIPGALPFADVKTMLDKYVNG